MHQRVRNQRRSQVIPIKNLRLVLLVREPTGLNRILLVSDNSETGSFSEAGGHYSRYGKTYTNNYADIKRKCKKSLISLPSDVAFGGSSRDLFLHPAYRAAFYLWPVQFDT